MQDVNAEPKRLARAEATLSSLQSEVAALKSDVVHVREDIRDVHAAVQDLNSSFKHGAKTNWSVVLAAAGVVLSFVIYYNHLIITPLDDRLTVHRAALDRINQRNMIREREIGRETFLVEEMKKRQENALDILTRRGILADTKQ